MNDAARILVVDDDEDTRDAVAALLAGQGYLVETACDGRQANEMLERDPPALVVSDVRMPGGDGLSVVRHLREWPELASLPILLMSAAEATSGEITGLDLGADDYLAKPFAGAVLLARVRALLRRAAQQRDLDRRARVDVLTGVLNRRGIYAVLGRERERSLRSGGPLSLALVDIDRFKRINDLLGHAAGDAVLRDVAHVLVANARVADDVGRLGGDEFVMVLVDTDAAGATLLAARLRALRMPMTPPSLGDVQVSLSAGTATLVGDETVDALLARADAAMYADKRSRITD